MSSLSGERTGSASGTGDGNWNGLTVAGVITAAELSSINSFAGLSPRQFDRLITALRHEDADPVRKGPPWSLLLEDRVHLATAYQWTDLTLRRLAPPFGVPKSAADRIVDHLGSALALQPRRRFRKGVVLIVDGTLVPTRVHSIYEQSKNYRYSTNHQVVIDADSRLVVAAGRCRATQRLQGMSREGRRR